MTRKKLYYIQPLDITVKIFCLFDVILQFRVIQNCHPYSSFRVWCPSDSTSGAGMNISPILFNLPYYQKSLEDLHLHVKQCATNRFEPHFLCVSNRVEHQKLKLRVFGVQLGLRRTQALFKTKTIRRGKVPPAISQFITKQYIWWHFSCSYRFGLKQCLYLPKAEVNTKNSKVEFLVLSSITHVIKKFGSNRLLPHCFI